VELGRNWGDASLQRAPASRTSTKADQFGHSHDHFLFNKHREHKLRRSSKVRNCDVGPNLKPVFESRSGLIWWISLLGIFMVALSAFRSLPQIADLLVNADGDDLMRLVQVRDLLGGQGWFDTRQYRILPPEGVAMHWSRYVDAGIAGVKAVAELVLPPAQADLATVILWPCLLASIMVIVLAQGTARLMGTSAALGAIAVFLTWGKLGGEFVPPRIDHHNVQILCGTVIFYLSLVPGRAVVLGSFAGVMTALSLAVGLEMLPFLALVWGMMALRHVFGQTQAGPWLLGFSVCITLAAPLLMAGQTAPADWLADHCDVLAGPVLALAAVGVVATATPVLAGRALVAPRLRLLLMATLAALGLWLAWPALGHCVAGPYAEVTPEVRRIIESHVVEALPASALLATKPELLFRVLLPPLVLSVLATLVAWTLRHRLGPVQIMALVQTLVVVVVGFALATVQIRAANIMAPAVPLLGGFLVQAFMLLPRESSARLPAAILLILAMPAVVERGTAMALRGVTAPGKGTEALAPLAGCHTAEAMSEIASLPKSLVFANLNLGPAILAYSSHSVASAAYHRSPYAFRNGVEAFQSFDNLHEALRQSGAEYLVLCAQGGWDQDSPIVQSLLHDPPPVWLSPATGDREAVRVFRVDQAALVWSVP
jgi:hypothetical protein